MTTLGCPIQTCDTAVPVPLVDPDLAASDLADHLLNRHDIGGYEALGWLTIAQVNDADQWSTDQLVAEIPDYITADLALTSAQAGGDEGRQG